MQSYYQEEINYLNQAAKDFAKAHPEQAQFLNIESIKDRDPYVERLFEGFAFLVARVQLKLDDEIPEFYEELLNLLWPHFLRGIPSVSTLEFKVRPNMLQNSTLIPVGTEVTSQPAGKENVVCRFQTCQNVMLQPITLVQAKLGYSGYGSATILLNYNLDKGVEFTNLQLEPLRLHLHGNFPITSELHYQLTRRVEKVIFRAAGVNDLIIEGQKSVVASGFELDQSLFPASHHPYSSFRLLQEYFIFREKFLYIDLLNLSKLKLPKTVNQFEIEIILKGEYPEEKRFSAENLLLHCTPVVNLFTMDAKPIRLDQTQFEYKITPDPNYPNSYEVYSVQKLTGINEKTGEKYPYVPFHTYKHDLELNSEEGGRFYRCTSRPRSADLYETYLSVGGVKLKENDFETETLSLEIMATNGVIPREALHEGSISVPAPDFPGIATFRNIIRPSLPFRPPGTKNYQWQLLSHLAMNYLPITNAEAFKGLLELYDWSGSEANQRRLRGIRNVQVEPLEKVVRGSLFRGIEIVLEVSQTDFADDGDIALFGLVLHHFFELYITINSFCQLTILALPAGKKFTWEAIPGKNLPL